MTKECPCKDCKRRMIGCHAGCEDYKAWRAWRSDVSAWLREHRSPTSKRAMDVHYRRIMRRARGRDRKSSDR